MKVCVAVFMAFQIKVGFLLVGFVILLFNQFNLEEFKLIFRSNDVNCSLSYF